MCGVGGLFNFMKKKFIYFSERERECVCVYVCKKVRKVVRENKRERVTDCKFIRGSENEGM